MEHWRLPGTRNMAARQKDVGWVCRAELEASDTLLMDFTNG